ncbi:MAG: prepilin-type N-terminal cleavage/methylation domain-containing protein [bacterium]
MKRSGFSLIEVNMAVFVLAIGVLSMAALYPLGLRESIQSQADLKQSMFADYILNVAVSAASSTNVTWSEWNSWANTYNMAGAAAGTEKNIGDSIPPFVLTALQTAVNNYNGNQLSGFQHTRNQTFAMYCVMAQGPSARIMGIMVRSLDMDTSKMTSTERIKRLEGQPSYYAEARFQGIP